MQTLSESYTMLVVRRPQVSKVSKMAIIPNWVYRYSSNGILKDFVGEIDLLILKCIWIGKMT